MINSDPGDPHRTHEAMTRYVQYGDTGRVERGITTLMRQAQISSTDCTPRVQAIGVFREVITALRACGEDPEGAWRTALAHRDGLPKDERHGA